MMDFNKRFDRVFITGDIHGDMNDLASRVAYVGDTTKDDLLILLGDIGFFYSVYFGKQNKDFERQKWAEELPITLLCIQGNHEQPFKEMAAEKIKLLGGDGYESNGIYFAENGTTLNINGKKCLVIGGAYSVDKPWRLEMGNAWWENEELTDAELDGIFDAVKGQRFDWVLTHTCPFSNLPREMFLSYVDQSKVENRTEKSLERIKNCIEYEKWYCGHYHTDKVDGNIIFMFRSVLEII
jgi:3-oxoacid CoA-transferase subunit A